MSKLIAVASLVAGLTSAAAMATAADIQSAPAGYSMTADIWGGYYFLGNSSGGADDDGLDKGFGALGGDLTYQTGVGSNYIMQLGLQAGFNAVDDGDDDQATGGGQASVHVLNSSGFGAFGGGGVMTYEGEPASGLFFAGAEYLYQFGSGDAALQAGFLDAGGPGQQLREAWFVNMAPRFSISDTMSAEAHAGVAVGDAQDPKTKVYSWGLSLKHSLSSYPASVFVAYDGLAVDGSNANADEHLVKAGLSFSLGGEADHNIATPEIYRWVGIGQRTD